MLISHKFISFFVQILRFYYTISTILCKSSLIEMKNALKMCCIAVCVYPSTSIADDSMTILMAFQKSEIEVLGLTTVFGNVSTEDATRNALLLVLYYTPY